VRLAEYSLHAYALRYARPVVWSDIVEAAAPFVLLRLISDSGESGVAEVTVKPTWGGVTARSLIVTVEDIFIPLLRTLDLSDPRAVRRALDRVPENLAAKCLVDNACWDLKAAQLRESLWRVWDGAPRVALSWAVTRQAPRAMAEEAVTMCDAHGFRTLKVKGGQGIDTDILGIREIRMAVGDGVALYVDANGAYPARDAAQYARAVAAAGAVVLEDPGPLEPDKSFDALRAESPIPVLVDFGIWSLRDARLFLARGAQALSIKPGRFGLSDAWLMQKAAARASAGVVAGLMGESALGTLAALQFAAALPQPILPAELTWFLAMTEQVTTEVPKIVDGAVDLPEVPSLATLVDWDAVKRFAL
jgi:L-alanine-DL-glutamate epimerase-like enolase superfamily enzyme